MWGNLNPDRPHDPARPGRWNYTPALRWIRRVLILVDLSQTKQLVDEQMSDQMSDVMSVTPCDQLPDLRTSEEMALFTYACLVTPSQIQITSVGGLRNPIISLY